MSLLQVFWTRTTEWQVALWTHIQLSLSSLLIALFIALPTAIIVFRRPKVAEVILQLTGAIQTVPSLALLGLLIPLIGIGTLPAVAALVLYAIFPILQSTLNGLRSIDLSLEEAATAFGLNQWEKLIVYQLPLAMPVVMGGVRTASVLIIGTATLAALVGAGGLGTFILLGIDRHDNALMLIGALSAVALAAIFGFYLRFIQAKPLRQLGRHLLVITFISIFSVLPWKKATHEPLVIAGKLGVEPDILIHMYKYLIEAHTPYQVQLKPHFGTTLFLYESLKNGHIHLYPEYTGTALSSLLKAHHTSQNPDQVYTTAAKGLRLQDDLVYLPPMAFQNTYALAVTQSYAEQWQLHRISDLHKVASHALAGFSLEFNERGDGQLGLQSLYGLTLRVKTMATALSYAAIQNNHIQITAVYSTDSKIISHQLRLLEDDKQLFPPYQAGPLLQAKTLQHYPLLSKALAPLSGQISTQEMIAMNYEVEVLKKPSAEVAKNFLVQKKLLLP